jgi:hypothetical protein
MFVFVLIAICCGHNPTFTVAIGRFDAPSMTVTVLVADEIDLVRLDVASTMSPMGRLTSRAHTPAVTLPKLPAYWNTREGRPAGTHSSSD